jgi:hypothetical protein
MEREGYSYKPNIEEERKLVYKPLFDERDYASFGSLSAQEQQRLKAYTQQQLETYVGERMHVAVSVVRYEIVDGKIFSAQTNEFLESMIQRGIENRRKDGNPIDFAREDAELRGIRRTQAKFVDEDTQVGAMNLSISPPGEKGSDYTNNFFDLFILRQDKKGRYIEMRRYLSNLTIDDYRKRMTPFKVFESRPTAVEFLEDPIEVDSFDNPDEVQNYLSGGVEALEKEELEKINRINAPLIVSYINSLIDNPHDYFGHRLGYNAILNQSDISREAIQRQDAKLVEDLYLALAFAPQGRVEEQVWSLGMRQVRQDAGPCPGVSKGINLSGGMTGSFSELNASFSVAEFGGLNKSEEWDGKYNEKGPCVACGQDVPCGPCKVCESCTEADNAKRRLAA